MMLGGCIEFENQEVEWLYDAAKDEIRATLRYEGIYGGDGKQKDGKAPNKELTKQEIQQLENVMKGGRAFFFNNWISEFNRTRMQESLKDIEGIPEETADRLVQTLLDGAEVQNVGFYLDRDGKLCGAQTFKLGKVSDVLGLTHQLVTEKALEEIQSKLDGEDGSTTSGESRGGTGFLPGMDINKMIGRLERVKYEQMRMSGIIRLGGKYQIHLEDIGGEQSFWLKEGKSNRGFRIVEVNMEEGYAKIRKNAQTAKVHLRSKEIVAVGEDAGDGMELENMQAWAKAIESKESFIGKTQNGFFFRIPLTGKQWEEAQLGSPFPQGMNVAHDQDWLALDVGQPPGETGLLSKECFPGYAPNALEHVRQQYGLKRRKEVDAVMANFLKE